MIKVLRIFQYHQNIFNKFIFFSLAILLLNQNSQAKPVQFFYPELPENISIFIDKKQIKKYYLILAKINSGKQPIGKKEKKNFKAKVIFKQNGKEKSLDAKIRITGDWQDHVTTVNSSLKIKLLNGNIGNITSFKLLLPTTQDPALPHKATGRSEIFWSLLMEKLNFPSLHRELIKINLNGHRYNAIFQESPAKEFLERWSIKETPIIEFDERELWFKRIFNDSDKNPSHISPKIVNGSFLKNNTSIKIANNALFNPISQNSFIEYPDINVWNKNLYIFLNNKYASHGLITHNLNFIYEDYYQIFYPLYKEGLVKIPKCNNFLDKSFINQNSNFIKVFETRIKSKINKNELCFLKKILNEIKNYKNIDDKRIKGPEKDLAKIKMINNTELSQAYFGVKKNSNYVEVCNYIKSSKDYCKLITFRDAKKYFKGEYDSKKIDTKMPFPIFFQEFEKKKINFKKLSSENSIIISDTDENKFFYVSKNTLKLDIELKENTKGNVILIGNFNPKIKVYLKDNRSMESLNKNFDWNDNFVTGCLTFLDSRFYGGEIKVENSKCEDSINIIRSSGFINKIEIKNSFSDGVDFDFSKLDIKNISVKNSGNDCADFSYGEYILSNATFINCGDKAVSVGEKSKLKLKNFVINKTLIGVVSKDSSNVSIENGKINNNQDFCLASYNKKQEFDGAYLEYSDINCDNKTLFSDSQSKLITLTNEK
tara:strand:- start:698 stop:2833 length:2136 start_codon:yes stop_codon:yes gene_type:complete